MEIAPVPGQAYAQAALSGLYGGAQIAASAYDRAKASQIQMLLEKQKLDQLTASQKAQRSQEKAIADAQLKQRAIESGNYDPVTGQARQPLSYEQYANIGLPQSGSEIALRGAQGASLSAGAAATTESTRQSKTAFGVGTKPFLLQHGQASADTATAGARTATAGAEIKEGESSGFNTLTPKQRGLGAAGALSMSEYGQAREAGQTGAAEINARAKQRQEIVSELNTIQSKPTVGLDELKAMSMDDLLKLKVGGIKNFASRADSSRAQALQQKLSQLDEEDRQSRQAPTGGQGESKPGQPLQTLTPDQASQIAPGTPFLGTDGKQYIKR